MVEHLPHDPRWPRFVAAAGKRGVRSQLAVLLYDDEQTVAGLNLYSTTSDTVAEDTVRLAEAFAACAAHALGHQRPEDQLHDALATRRAVGIATGIVMERHRLDHDAAFRYLVRVACNAGTEVGAVAEALVRSVDEERE